MLGGSAVLVEDAQASSSVLRVERSAAPHAYAQQSLGRRKAGETVIVQPPANFQA